MPFLNKYAIIYIESIEERGRAVIHRVKCYFCGSTFDRDKEAFVAVPGTARRYAHQACYERSQSDQTAVENDKLALENYIKKLFQTDYVPPLAQKQIKEYVTKNEYTYSGILKTLRYFYEVKQGDISKARNGIGIVPFVYQDAYLYYRAIWEAQEQNKRILEQENSVLAPRTIEIHITSPQRTVMGRKRNPFAFLDEELEEKGDV